MPRHQPVSWPWGGRCDLGPAAGPSHQLPRRFQANSLLQVGCSTAPRSRHWCTASEAGAAAGRACSTHQFLQRTHTPPRGVFQPRSIQRRRRQQQPPRHRHHGKSRDAAALASQAKSRAQCLFPKSWQGYSWTGSVSLGMHFEQNFTVFTVISQTSVIPTVRADMSIPRAVRSRAAGCRSCP